MQKSYRGLLQAVLHDLFRQSPDLVELVCVERWPKSLEELSYEPWNLPELHHVLQRVATRGDLGAKFCIFIDGLDEYEGDYLDICRGLRELSNSPHVKLCVSSRPWNVFEDSFGREEVRKLYVHDFTRSDILSYTKSRLQDHPRWDEVNIEVEDAKWLVEEIAERADGVFLWVFLVTRDLRSGLTEYDSFSDMRRRLDKIPTDLEVFFKQILDSVEPFYHEKMATTLQISLMARQPAPAIIYSFHDEEYEDQDYAIKLPLGTLNDQRAVSRKKQMLHRLNSRCRGLLEVNRSSGCVEFLHRTVMDYLRTQAISAYLQQKAPGWSSPHLSLLKAFTAYMKSTKFSEFVDRTGFATYTSSKFMSALKEALAHARQLGQSAAAFELLEELERCIPAMQSNGQARLNVWGNTSNPVCLFFREPAIEARLDKYLCHILPKTPDYFVNFEASAIERVNFFMPGLLSAQKLRRSEIDNSQFLLQRGRGVIEIPSDAGKFHAKTQEMWIALLEHSLPSNPNDGLDTSSRLAWLLESRSILLMLKQGADPNTKIPCQASPGYTIAWLWFTATSFDVVLTSSLRELFLRDLDEFIAAGANMRALVSVSLFDESGSSRISGLDAFFNQLSRKTNLNSLDGRLNNQFLALITEKLMLKARGMGMEIDCYWHIIEERFRPPVVSLIREAFAMFGPEPEAQLAKAGSRAQKRLLHNTESGERICKRAKSV